MRNLRLMSRIDRLSAPVARPLAYSYVRFSTPEQAKGNSQRRQLEAAEQYAAKNGLELSRENFRDLGVSAWQGTNVATGALGAFLSAVRQGDIVPGSYLLVESLDRVSRSNARSALRVLEEIVDAGVKVVTLNDGKLYTAETLNSDPMSLMMSILIFMRGNEESETKSARVRDAWQKKKELARKEGRPMTKVLPGWMKLNEDGSKVVLDDARAAVVRSIVEDATAGVGLAKIAADLNARGVEPWGEGRKRAAFWHRTYVSKIIRTPALVGTFTPRSSHKQEGRRVFVPLDPIENYYPPVITRAEYERLQERSGGGRLPQMSAATGKVSSSLAGLARCPLCGATMTRVNKGRKGGMPYLVCVAAKAGAGCDYKAVRLPYVEAALRRHAQELCNTAPDRDTELDDQWVALGQEIDNHDHAISNIVEEIQNGSRSTALREQLARLEDNRASLRERQKGLEAALYRSSGNTLHRLLDALEHTLLDESSSAAQVNAAMRPLISAVEVDYVNGSLNFRWRHSDRQTSISFSMPLGA